MGLVMLVFCLGIAVVTSIAVAVSYNYFVADPAFEALWRQEKEKRRDEWAREMQRRREVVD